MNKQGNTYTFLYSVVLVVVVAALLSIVSLSLQPRQNENRQNEKRQNILSAIHISSTAANSAELFDKYIKEQFIINSKGDRIEGKAFDVNIEKQYNLPVEKRELPWPVGPWGPVACAGPGHGPAGARPETAMPARQGAGGATRMPALHCQTGHPESSASPGPRQPAAATGQSVLQCPKALQRREKSFASCGRLHQQCSIFLKTTTGAIATQSCNHTGRSLCNRLVVMGHGVIELRKAVHLQRMQLLPAL